MRNYFVIYHPEYNEQLIDAICIRMEKLMDKVKSGEPLTDEELTYFTKKENAYDWDPEEEIAQ